MNSSIEKMIASLLVDKQAKDILRGADRILNSKLEKVRENASALLVIAGEGCGFSSYGRVYSAIVDASVSQPIRGTSTFLELVFPKDNEADEKLFFASPRRKASIRNRFYGTMLISLKEYTGQDLIKSVSFKHLLEFIELNKTNIHFLFHVLPEFDARNQLIARLQNVVNITEVFLDKPDLENSYAYVVSELRNQGYLIGEAAHQCLKEKVLPSVISRKTYTGYRSLNNLLGRLNYETAMMTENDELVISQYILNNLIAKFEKEKRLSENETIKIGFGR